LRNKNIYWLGNLLKNLHLENRESEGRLIAKIVTIGLKGTDFGGYFVDGMG